jgi:acetamidase/formamidase
VTSTAVPPPPVLQPGEGSLAGSRYLASDPATVRWGWLPNANAAPVLAVDDGAAVTIDTVSHEGLMEDQGRDPVAFFGAHGVAPEDVLKDGREIAAAVDHTYRVAGPHVVTGPIAVRGARPGDVLRVDMLALEPRVPYGVISNRHGFGVLAGEMPEGPGPDPEADPADWARRYGTVSRFCQVEPAPAGGLVGRLDYGPGRAARFPLAPFLGVVGVAPATEEPVHSTPPGSHGGNIDLNELVAGTSLYLPVTVDGALFYAGDPHFAQGDGEVCLTALEASLRATVRLSVLRGSEARRAAGLLADPFAETATHWVPTGLHVDLEEAVRRATRAALAFLGERFGMPRADAYAYLSAAADFELTQVVDHVKGVHCRIRKADFA